MTPMPNNLDAMISRSGMSKREVAALKGITPETLSRQIHGKIQMTLQDAEYYGKILDCSPQDILFATPPVPIIGYCHLVSCDHKDLDCPAHGAHVERRISAGETMGKVYLQSYMQQNTGAVLWSKAEGYSGMWEHWDSAVEFIELGPVENGFVSQNAIQQGCYALLEDPVEMFGMEQRLVHGTLFPEPGGLYTVHSAETQISLKGQKLAWASAVLDVSFQPKLRGMQIILDK